MKAFNDFLKKTEFKDYVLERIRAGGGYYVVVPRDEDADRMKMKYGDPTAWFEQSLLVSNVNQATFGQLLAMVKSRAENR